ncbi:hypothetical protein D3C71_1842510 [compost metagenome]
MNYKTIQQLFENDRFFSCDGNLHLAFIGVNSVVGPEIKWISKFNYQDIFLTTMIFESPSSFNSCNLNPKDYDLMMNIILQ